MGHLAGSADGSSAFRARRDTHGSHVLRLRFSKGGADGPSALPALTGIQRLEEVTNVRMVN